MTRRSQLFEEQKNIPCREVLPNVTALMKAPNQVKLGCRTVEVGKDKIDLCVDFMTRMIEKPQDIITGKKNNWSFAVKKIILAAMSGPKRGRRGARRSLQQLRRGMVVTQMHEIIIMKEICSNVCGTTETHLQNVL